MAAIVIPLGNIQSATHLEGGMTVGPASDEQLLFEVYAAPFGSD